MNDPMAAVLSPTLPLVPVHMAASILQRFEHGAKQLDGWSGPLAATVPSVQCGPWDGHKHRNVLQAQDKLSVGDLRM